MCALRKNSYSSEKTVAAAKRLQKDTIFKNDVKNRLGTISQRL